MNKLFFILLASCFVGAGVLWWLMRSIPNSSLTTVVATDKLKPAENESDKGPEKEGEKSAEAAGPEHADEKASEKIDEKKEEKKEEKKDEKHAETKHAEEKHESAAQKIAISTEPVSAKVFSGGDLKGTTPLELELTSKEQVLRFEAEGFEDYIKEIPAGSEHLSEGDLKVSVQLQAKPKAEVAKEESHEKIAPAVKAPVKPVVRKTPFSPDHKAEVAKTKSVKAPKVEKTETPKTETVKPEAAKTVASKVTSVAEKPSWLTTQSVGPFVIQIKSVKRPEKIESLDSELNEVATKTAASIKACPVDLKAKGQWVRYIVGPFESRAEAKVELDRITPSLTEAPILTGSQPCRQ